MTSKLDDPYLFLASQVLDDIERTRIAQGNRLGIMTRSTMDVDGEVRGFGLDESHPDVARLAGMVDALKAIEAEAIKGLQKTLKGHPLHEWISNTKGIGLKQGGRLLAAIGGDPYWNGQDDCPRTVSALWAYCGLHVVQKTVVAEGVPDDTSTGTGTKELAGGRPEIGDQTTHATGDHVLRDHHSSTVASGHSRSDARATDASSDRGGTARQSQDDSQSSITVGVAPRRQRGVRANWSTIAKTRAYLAATSCIKHRDKQCKPKDVPDDELAMSSHVDDCGCSPFRLTYDRRKAHTYTTHPEWTDGHRHADALRVTAKDILRCMWREARAFYTGSPEGSPKDETGQETSADTRSGHAGPTTPGTSDTQSRPAGRRPSDAQASGAGQRTSDTRTSRARTATPNASPPVDAPATPGHEPPADLKARRTRRTTVHSGAM